MQMLNRKGQEEMIGFIAIVVLVAIVFLVFLAINIRNPSPEQRQSEVVYQFLESSMEQTTDCALSEGASYLDLDDLLRECHSSNRECVNELRSCDVLNMTFEGILNNSWRYGEGLPIKGYVVDVIYNFNSSGQRSTEEILSIPAGTCNGDISGNSYWIPAFPGNIQVTFELCS